MASAEEAKWLEGRARVRLFTVYPLVPFEPYECISFSKIKSFLNEVSRVKRAEETVWLLLGRALATNRSLFTSLASQT